MGSLKKKYNRALIRITFSVKIFSSLGMYKKEGERKSTHPIEAPETKDTTHKVDTGILKFISSSDSSLNVGASVFRTIKKNTNRVE